MAENPNAPQKTFSRAELVYRFFWGEPTRFKSYQELIPSQQPLTGPRLTKAQFETSANMYGPPPGWDYRTSQRGWKGEDLPEGAYGWTPQGEPYFRSGLVGNPVLGPLTGDLSQWAKGLPARFAPIFQKDKDGNPVLGAGARVGLALGQTLSGVGEAWAALFSKPVKSYIGISQGLQEAGEGSNLPDVEEMLRRKLPTGWFSEYVLSMNPLLIGYNSIRAFTSPIPYTDKRNIFEANLQASRIAYSAWVDPALRQQYIQRYRSGKEDPYLLAKEMQNPWTEMWGELILDPTNAAWGAGILAKFAGGSKALRAAEKALAPADEIVESFKILRGANSDSQTLESIQKLATASGNALSETGRVIGKAASEQRVWALTTESARNMIAADASDYGRFLLAQSRDNPEDAIEIMALLARRASPDVGRATEAVARLARHPTGMGELFFNEDANRLSLLLREIAGDTPGAFLDELAQVQGEPAKLMQFMGSKMEAATKRIMPTVAERLAAGEKLPERIVTLHRLAERVNRPVGFVNRVFAGIYMGLSPGYAIRNALTNGLHMLVDYGPEVLRRGPRANLEQTAKLLGFDPGRMFQEFGQYASARGVSRSRLPFAKLSAWFEKTAGQLVYGHAIRKTMRSLMVPGRGLPDIKPLIDAGMSPEAVRHLVDIAWREGGNVEGIRKVFTAAHASGSIDAFRNLEFLEPEALKFLHDYNINGVALYDLVADAIRPLDNAEDALREVAAIFDAFDEEASHVFKEAPMLNVQDLERWRPGTAQVLSLAKKLGISHSESGALMAQRALAGEAAREAIQGLIATEFQRMMPYLTSGRVDAQAAAQLNEMAARMAVSLTERMQQTDDALKIARDTAWANTARGMARSEKDVIWGAYSDRASALYSDFATTSYDELAKYMRDMAKAVPNYDLTPIQRVLEETAEARMWHEATFEAGEFVVKRGEEVIRLVPQLTDAAPTLSRFMHETSVPRNVVRNLVSQGLQDNWGTKRLVSIAPDALDAWLAQAKGTVASARAVAMKVGDAARDFTLLNYGAKRGLDSVMGYLYPYQYWYGRTYANWMRRFAQNPQILAHYQKYRGALEDAHAGMPDFYKYQLNTNELFGLDSENPHFFNLEATLNPLNGLVGVDFNDRDRRKGWLAAFLDDLGKFGPSLWTPINYAVAVDMWRKGESEAAATWAGRLIPQTASLKSALGLVRGRVSDLPLDGEFDPAVQMFAGGMDPWERSRVGRALGGMVEEGIVDRDAATEAARLQAGPIWDAALDRAVNQRAPGQLASFIAGVGFKSRTTADIQIDMFWKDYFRLFGMRPNLSPEEWRNSWDNLHSAYPFMDALLLARKGGAERDTAYANNVLSRIPPSQSDDLAELAGIPKELISKFYDEKGHMEAWPEPDRLRFLAGMVELGAILATPDDATRAEWTDARLAYNRILNGIKAQYGDDIWDKVDAYYALRGPTERDLARSRAYLEAHPEVEDARDAKTQQILASDAARDYYAAINEVEGFYNGRMWNAVEQELGSDIWDKWDEYWALPAGSARRAYWAANPELSRYHAVKAFWQQLVAERLVAIDGKLRDIKPELRDSVGLTAGQEAIVGGLGRETLPSMSWGEWQEALGGNLSRLILDSVQGDVLPKSAMDRLKDTAEGLGISNPYLALQLAQQAAQMEVGLGQ